MKIPFGDGITSTVFRNITPFATLLSISTATFFTIILTDKSDVGVALDPNYADVTEKNNTAILNGGIALMKYSGSRGKAGASDASAELVAKIRKIFNEYARGRKCNIFLYKNDRTRPS